MRQPNQRKINGGFEKIVLIFLPCGLTIALEIETDPSIAFAAFLRSDGSRLHQRSSHPVNFSGRETYFEGASDVRKLGNGSHWEDPRVLPSLPQLEMENYVRDIWCC